MGANVSTQTQEEEVNPPNSIRLPTLDDLKGLEEIQELVFGNKKRSTIMTNPSNQSPQQNHEQPKSSLTENINSIPQTLKSYIDDDKDIPKTSQINEDPFEINYNVKHTPKISEIQSDIPEINQSGKDISEINQVNHRNSKIDSSQSQSGKKVYIAINYIDGNSNIVSEKPQEQEKVSYIEVSQQQSNSQLRQDQVKISSSQQAFKVMDSSALQLQQANQTKQI